MYTEFAYYGDFWTLKKHPQTVEDFTRDSGNYWLSLRCFTIFRKVSKFSEMFSADFEGFSGQISGMFWAYFRDQSYSFIFDNHGH